MNRARLRASVLFMERLMGHTLRGLHVVVLTLLCMLWERALRLGPAYDPSRPPNLAALSECDWGGIIISSALLVPLSLPGPVAPMLRSSGRRLVQLVVPVVGMQPLALFIYLTLCLFDYVD